MKNEDMLKRICTGASAKELQWFVNHGYEIGVGSENLFEEYYNLRWILKFIENYQTKVVDAEYLRNWTDSYYRILSENYFADKNTDKSPLRENVIDEIFEWLFMLSHFDESDIYFDLEKFKRIFTSLDLILQDINQCKFILSKYESDDEYVVLIFNESSKYFAKMDVHDPLSGDVSEVVDPSKVKDAIQRMKECGFNEFKFRIWDDDEIAELESRGKLITFEESYEIAKEEKEIIDLCSEFERGFVFVNSKDPLTIGGPYYQPVVVLRKDGKTVNMTYFLMTMGQGKLVKRIPLSKGEK